MQGSLGGKMGGSKELQMCSLHTQRRVMSVKTGTKVNISIALSNRSRKQQELIKPYGAEVILYQIIVQTTLLPRK